MVEYNYSAMGKKGSRNRWDKIHSMVKIRNKLSKEKVAIMAYLAGDGHISMKKEQFRYEIRFFIDSILIANRIVALFNKEFGIQPKIRYVVSKVSGGKGYFKVEIKNKPACFHLMSLGSYTGLSWTIPKDVSNDLMAEWIRGFFDCEAYVNMHNRQIQVKSINGNGLNDIRERLLLFGINSKVYGPYDNGLNHNPYFMLTIYNLGDLKKYNNLIGFYHPDKKNNLRRFLKLK